MNIDPKAQALGRGYVLSCEGGVETHRIPVVRDADGRWTRPHPTNPKGADVELRGERVYAWTDEELTTAAVRAEEWSRVVAAYEADRARVAP